MPSEISRSAPHAADILTLDGVSLGYGGEPVVEAVGGVIPRGALLALVGPNGAGKSTLLKALAGLHRPSTGSIDNRLVGQRPAYMPQHTAIDHAFPMSVIDFVAMGLWREIGLWKPMSTRQRDQAHAALVQVGLGEVAQQRIGTLSGGQLRRVLFARVALQNAALILLDEPFAGVDASTSHDLMATIAAWNAQGRTIVAALHDLAQVRAHFPQTLLLERRVIAWGATAEVLAATQNAAVLGNDLRETGRAHV